MNTYICGPIICMVILEIGSQSWRSVSLLSKWDIDQLYPLDVITSYWQKEMIKIILFCTKSTKLLYNLFYKVIRITSDDIHQQCFSI